MIRSGVKKQSLRLSTTTRTASCSGIGSRYLWNARLPPVISRTTAAPQYASFDHSSTQFFLQQQRWMTASSSEDTTPKEEDESPPAPAIVYESPLGSVVAKLRGVSMMTAIIGSTGVPCMIAIKGAVPEMGMLAVAMTFVAGSIGSTVAIKFVFSPYVFRIESIPVRQCSYVKKQKSEGEDESASYEVAFEKESENSAASVASPKQAMLLRAWTRSLFLRHTDVVFDPELDVEPYTGMRPLCNFYAKGIPLYVHPEYVYDERLRKSMNLNIKSTIPQTKSNPDDDLL